MNAFEYNDDWRDNNGLITGARVRGLPVHPTASRFPMMDDEALTELAEDIGARGQLHRIVVFQGQLLDGRNRLAACELAGVEPSITTLARCDSPTAYVISANLKRRQLTPVQCAAIAVDPDVVASFKAEAKARQRDHGGTAPGKKNTSSENRLSVSDAERIKSQAVAQSAAAFGVKRDAAYKMQKVMREAPEVYQRAVGGEFATVAEAVNASLAPQARATAAPTSGAVLPTNLVAAITARPKAMSQRDQEISDLMTKENLGVYEVAERLSVSRSTVQAAKKRLGIDSSESNPLERLTNYAVEFSDTWEIALATDVSQWATATKEQKGALVNQLRTLNNKTCALIRRLNKEATGD